MSEPLRQSLPYLLVYSQQRYEEVLFASFADEENEVDESGGIYKENFNRRVATAIECIER